MRDGTPRAGLGRASAAQTGARANSLPLFARSRGEDPQAPAAVCPFCSEEPHRLHFVVCYPDHHAHQVRPPGCPPSRLCHQELLSSSPAVQGGPLLEAFRIVLESASGCLAETDDGAGSVAGEVGPESAIPTF